LLESSPVLAFFFIALFLPLFGIVGVIALLTRRFAYGPRVAVLVFTATLLLTPSFGPATITFVMVPFGLLFGIALFSGAWVDLGGLVGLFPVWHIVAFTGTAVVSYIAARVLLSNNRFERSRGDASSVSQGEGG
jgi:hypothetical protein